MPEEEAPPALFEHCIRVFERMHREAKSVTIEGQPALVYEGYLTRLFNELNMATPYYTTVMRRLKAMGCVKQLSRGGGSSPSRWELIEDPTFETFDEVEQRRIKTNTKLGQALDTVDTLTRRVNGLEDRIRILEEKEAV